MTQCDCISVRFYFFFLLLLSAVENLHLHFLKDTTAIVLWYFFLFKQLKSVKSIEEHQKKNVESNHALVNEENKKWIARNALSVARDDHQKEKDCCFIRYHFVDVM